MRSASVPYHQEESMATTSTSAPSSLKAGGERWLFGHLGTIRATGADTGGAYTLVELLAPAGLSGPLHVHHAENEYFLVLAGSVVLQVGDKPVEASAGDFVPGPVDVAHRYDAGPERGRLPRDLHPSRLREPRRSRERSRRGTDCPAPARGPIRELPGDRAAPRRRGARLGTGITSRR